MTSPLDQLALTLPVLAAPMAGGPSAVDLVHAAGRAGSLGFLAGGYKTAHQLAGQIQAVRSSTPAFGVNVFAPNAAVIAPAEYAAYAEAIRPVAERYGVDLPPAPIEDDDDWAAKIDLLTSDPVPVVSFTFGLPSAQLVSTLQSRGTLVVQSVTTVREAQAAAGLGVDLLVVQAAAAGAHSATLTPEVMPEDIPLTVLVETIRNATRIPIIAAGGLAEPTQVAAARHSGATAVMVGTALLRTPESGASATHQAALADPGGPDTVLTRAFSGRPARGIRNAFLDRFGPIAPVGYPAVHHLTIALRKAAAAAGDASALHLWAGTGYRHATAEPAADVLAGLAQKL